MIGRAPTAMAAPMTSKSVFQPSDRSSTTASGRPDSISPTAAAVVSATPSTSWPVVRTSDSTISRRNTSSSHTTICMSVLHPPSVFDEVDLVEHLVQLVARLDGPVALRGLRRAARRERSEDRPRRGVAELHHAVALAWVPSAGHHPMDAWRDHA